MSQIVAFSENKAIGRDNKLLWHYPEDLKYFKEKTSGKILIMGRKTFDSLGKPLPKRFHIVISRTPKKSDFTPGFESVIYVQTIPEAYAQAEKLIEQNLWPQEVMICGGAEIYKQTVNDCDFLFLTRIPGQFEADAFYDVEFATNFMNTESRKSDLVPDLTYQIWSKSETII